MENMRFKVGDRVRIKSIDWYNENKGNADKTNSVWCKDGGAWFFYHMSQHCGEIMTIKNVWVNSYTLAGSDSRWTDEMIECLVEEVNTLKIQSNDMETETHKGYCTTDVETTNESKKVAWFTFWDNDFADKVELDLSNRELIQEDGKWFVVKKKKEYPKTFRECQECLGEDVPPMEEPDSKTHRRRQVHLLEVLLICRDAYWKIAGEEMGLDGPWEQNWEDKIYYVYYERHRQYGIGIKKAYCYCGIRGNRILVFPTEKMRDAFYENFKELIEMCKELL